MNHATQQDIESWLWESANILRGPVDAADFKTYILDFADCDDPTGKSRDATEFAFIIGATESGGVLYSIDSADDLTGALAVVRQAYERITE